MKITIVCQYYWPDNFIINDIAEDLVKRGHSVKVLTGLPDYATTEVPEEYKHGRNRHHFHNGVEIFRVPIRARYKGFINRVVNYLSFFISSTVYAMMHYKELDCDAVMSYQLAPVLMANAAITLSRKLRKKLFLYCLDIWPDQMKVWNVYERNILFKITHSYCRYAYGKADILAVSSRPFTEYMVRVNRVNPEKIVYLPQHYDSIDEAPSHKNKDDERVNLIYAGNIGNQQNTECLLRATAMMRTKRSFMIHIYGEGTSYSECRELAEKLELNDRVKFYGRVPKDELKRIYPLMDAFILTLCSEKQIGYTAYTVPSRLQGYMAAGKPIIASIDGGAREIITEAGCGIAVPADDDEAFAGALSDFVDHMEKYSECGENARRYFAANFERSIIMDKIEACLKQLAGVKE